MGITDSQPGKWLPIGLNGERIVILQEDEEIHKGYRYTGLNLQTVGLSAESNIAITTNGAHEVHLTVGVESTKAGTWRMSEGASISGGSVVSVFNNNRKSSNDPESVVVASPTVTTVGTIIGYHVIGSSTGGSSKSGGTSGSRNEWILASDTTYLFTFTSDSADNRVVQGVYFYEEEK